MMTDHGKLYSPATIRMLQEKYGFRFSKSLGQNFLTDRNILETILDGAGIEAGDIVLEIGPGMGVLTAAAAMRGAWVTAVELDRNLIPILGEVLAGYPNIDLIQADILDLDLAALLEQKKAENGQKESRVKILGNLPYYITTAIIMHLLESHVPADSMTFMMQKEVADRIRSGPGGRTPGAISVAVQYYCEVVPVAVVSKEVFYPKPKVDSAVLRLNIREEKPVSLTGEATFFAVIRAGFGQRRKTLLNSLTGLTGPGGAPLAREAVKKVLDFAGIDPQRRAETLSLPEFARIANEIDFFCDRQK